jgi:hypothetical protein
MWTRTGALARARADLLTAAGAAAPAGGAGEQAGPRPARGGRHSSWWAAAAATVLALVAGLVFLQSGNQPVASAAARELNSAADKIGASDKPVGAGQYRYVATHAWYLQTDVPSEDEQFSYLEEHRIETWVPADWRQEWLRRETLTGKRQWVEGSEAQAREAGMRPPPRRTAEQRARCGDFRGVRALHVPGQLGPGDRRVHGHPAPGPAAAVRHAARLRGAGARRR